MAAVLDPDDIGHLGSGWRTPRRHTQPVDTANPVETGPSFRRSSLPHQEDAQRFQNLTKPHVESYNYFLQVGLDKGIRDIDPIELDLFPPALLRSVALQEPGAHEQLIKAKNDVTTIQIWVENIKISKPTRNSGMGRTGGNALMPRECRERSLVYAGPITGNLCFTVVERRNGIIVNRTRKPTKMVKNFGSMPIMVGSKGCHLDGLTPEQLVHAREESYEAGGYFIVNGNERCVRMLQIPRRNHPTSIQRSNYKNRGPTYTDLGVAMRCARYNGDMSAITNTVHYLTTGGASLRFTARKQEFLIPVILILRALSGGHVHSAIQSADAAAGGGANMGITDEELYHRIVQGDDTNTFLKARAELLLQDARTRFPDLNSPLECLAFIGSRFRRVSMKAESTGNVEIGKFILRKYVLIHLVDDGDKLECLLLLLRKLYSFAAGDSGVDNADSLQNQEILTPGHLICAFVKEKFEESLQGIRLGFVTELRKDFSRTSHRLQSGDMQYWGRLVDRFGGYKSGGGIGNKVKHFLSTGNIISTTGLDLMQVSGYTIVAERLNFLRYCAHFRSVHRGQFFLEMKTTAVRKLLPDQWGFMCPVHTPDGGPCGLLSHLSILTTILTFPDSKAMQNVKDSANAKDKWLDLDELLISLGVSPAGTGGTQGEGRGRALFSDLVVCLNGRVVGSATPALCKTIATHLRKLKVEDGGCVPRTLEVALVPAASAAGAPYPGLYLFTGAARLVRPVLQRTTGKTEMIGPMEQSFMDIACLDEDIREGITTHQELNPTNMLSLIANMTPFSDQNQSPRNMYQCQMGKQVRLVPWMRVHLFHSNLSLTPSLIFHTPQTMGTPAHSLPYRADNKLYRLQTPQAPVVQTGTHGEYKMDEYPNGTNAVVGTNDPIVCYTG